MEPTIKQKEMIIIKEQNEYHKGDIITYKENFGRLITHRIIEYKDGKYVTKGDFNDEVDDLVKKEHVEGKVIFHSYLLGLIFLYALKPCFVFIFLWYIFDFLKYFLLFRLLLK